jgi:4,5-DOPA dioxygenase extradiol
MKDNPSQSRMPIVYAGHGSPMNAMEDNNWSRGFKAAAIRFPKPRAILAISAHWYVSATLLTDNEQPETIHDFGGFPKALYEMQYPAAGDRELARQVVDLIGADRAAVSSEWGLDHGTWSVLCHLYPAADIPVVQLSIHTKHSPAEHLRIGELLAPLRDEGILILGSGNITHNLRHAMMNASRGDFSTPDWASRFDAAVATATQQRDSKALCELITTEDGKISHPTLDHYLPLLYATGAAGSTDKAEFFNEGFDLGSLSMRSIVWM